jgi:hypothetical protein
MQEINKILVVDRLVVGNNHVIFNVGFLSIISNLNPDSVIVFCAESEHSCIVKKKIENKNIIFNPTTNTKLVGSYLKKVIPWVKKNIEDVLFVRHVLHVHNVNIVYFTTLSTPSMFFLNFFAKKTRKTIYMTLHGEVEHLFKKKLRLIDQIRKMFYLGFIKHISKNIRLIVLSEIVKQKLHTTFHISKKKIIVMKHPIINIANRVVMLNDRIIFAHIGTASILKSSNLFFYLADSFRRKDANYSFWQIGKVEKKVTDQQSYSNVEVLGGCETIPQKEYETLISKIDYSIFTFDKDNYVYRNSGAVMDAIAYAKPIIALRQPFFDYLFETGGDIGFICENLEEMRFVLDKIINRDPLYVDKYTFQSQNLINMAKEYSLTEIESQIVGFI